jgi:hypothetical protein
MAHPCETPSRTDFSKGVEAIKNSFPWMLRQASHCDTRQWIPSLMNFLGCCWIQCNTTVLTSSYDLDLLPFSAHVSAKHIKCTQCKVWDIWMIIQHLLVYKMQHALDSVSHMGWGLCNMAPFKSRVGSFFLIAAQHFQMVPQ